MKAVRANAEGSSIGETTRVGELPAAIWPVTTSVPGVGSATATEVFMPVATVLTWFWTM